MSPCAVLLRSLVKFLDNSTAYDDAIALLHVSHHLKVLRVLILCMVSLAKTIFALMKQQVLDSFKLKTF